MGVLFQNLTNNTSNTDDFADNSTETTNTTVHSLVNDILIQFTQLPRSVHYNNSHLTTINPSDLEERLRNLLKEQNISVFQYFSRLSGIPSHTLPTTTTIKVPYTSGVVSWGFITPITLIGMFLIFVAICLCYQNWREKQRLRSYSPTGPVPVFSSEITGSLKHEAGSRDSIRSNTSARSIGSNTFDKPQLIPQPRKIRNDDIWKTSGPSRILSPIDENDTSNSRNTIIEVKPHRERFPSYQMSWLTEAAKEVDGSSKKEINTTGVNIAENPLPNQLRNDQYYEDKPQARQLEHRSPCYPHYNTPTNEFDGASECSDNLCGGDSALSTHINDNISLPSTIYPALGRAPLSVTGGTDLSSINTYLDQQRPPSRRTEDFNAPSEQTSATTSFTESMSGTLSLPSSISKFHASRLNNTPNPNYPLASTHNGSPAKLNFTVTSSIDLSENNSQYSDNTSMFPNVGSSITSFGPSVSRSNPNSSCPSDISADYCNGNVRPGTGRSTRQTSFSTDSDGSNPQVNETSGASLVKEAEMFRNWSLSAGINSGSLGNLPALAPTPLPSGESYSLNQTKDDSSQSKSDGHITLNSYDFNHNLSPSDRKVKFSVPVLNKKQYWV